MDADRFVDATAAHGAQIAIITYWRSFEDHEHSHQDTAVRSKFDALLALCSDQQETAYEMKRNTCAACCGCCNEAMRTSARRPGA